MSQRFDWIQQPLEELMNFQFSPKKSFDLYRILWCEF